MKSWLENTITGVATVILVPLAILSSVGGIISGLWLLIIGEWQVVILGFIISFLFPWIYSLVMIPNFGILWLTNWFFERKLKILTWLFLFMGSVYSQIVLVWWVFAVLNGFVIENATQQNFIPLLLWGFSMVASPLIYMAKGEDDSSTSFLMVFLVETVYILLALVALFSSNYLLIQSIIAILFILVWAIFATILAASTMFTNKD